MANTFIYQMTDTWANAAQEFVAINMNVTDTASTANSALLNLAVGGANQFTVYKTGDVFASGGLGANTVYTNTVKDGIIIDYDPVLTTGRIMVGANDTFVFYSGNSTAVGANTVMMTISNTGVTSMGNTSANVQLGGITSAGYSAVVTGLGNSNASIAIIVSNANTGGNTSADFAAYDGGGLSGVNFIDMGISGNTWSNASWTIGGASDGYLYTGNTNLSIGTAGGTGSNGFINFFTNGTLIANERMRITPGGNVGIANTAPDATFAVTGTANISGAVRMASTLTVANTFTHTSTAGNYGSSTSAATYQLGYGATTTGLLKTINLGTGGAAGSTTNVNIGSTLSNTFVTINANTVSYTGALSGITTLAAGNTTIVGILAIGTTAANSIVNTTSHSVANATAYSNVGLATIQTTAGQIMVGNLATTNAVVNTSGMFAFGNSINYIAETTANATVLAGNATVYSAINATSIVTSGNTLIFAGGTAAAQAANGWSILPNGMKANWGWIAANTTAANATFTSAFVTACLHVFLTPVSATATGPYLIQPANTTVAPIRTTSTTSANVAYYAIGY